jgi:hypothetical protein
MQIKYLHEAMQQFSDNFTRNMTFSGVVVRTVYKFPQEIPYLENKAVVAYYGNSSVNVDKSENVVYDYSALLNAETEEQVRNPEVKTYLISELTRDKYVEIVQNNVVVSEKMKKLRDELELLKEIERI